MRKAFCRAERAKWPHENEKFFNKSLSKNANFLICYKGRVLPIHIIKLANLEYFS